MLAQHRTDKPQRHQPRYDHIWDCCCDHGLLGAELIKQELGRTVHFVDIVPSIMDNVTSKLQRFLPNLPNETPRWQTHCIDVKTIAFNQYQGSHLVIIAGVGGELICDMISAIIDKHPTIKFQFLLCPVHHLYDVRAHLGQHCYLIDEKLIEDNQRFYELLWVTRDQKVSIKSISLVGQEIWQYHNEAQRELKSRYLHSLIKHYQYRFDKHQDSHTQAILHDYLRLSENR